MDVGRNGFDTRSQEWLDGERREEAASSDAARFEDLLEQYRDGLTVVGPELDRAVMSAVRRQSATRRAPWWRWLFQPQQITLRPVVGVLGLAAAAIVVFLAGPGSQPTPDAGPSASATVLVRFEFQAPDARGVALAGSFNDWDQTAIPLSRSDGVWSVTVPLAPGEYEYLFVVDGDRWLPDPRAHAQVDDGFGQSNSVIAVGPRGVIRS